MASWLLSSGFQPKWKKCGKISCSQTHCQKNTFKAFWLNRNSNHIPESGLEPKLKRSAQISCFGFPSYQIFLCKPIFKSTSMHTCKSVSIHMQSVMLGCSQWAPCLYLYMYKASQKYFSSSAIWKCYICAKNGTRHYPHKFGIVKVFINNLGNIRF